ncbi:hypothetical protein EDC04DRAFT_2602428 [Pisolithus marmoratus]|nr:hypothetical protein EDC04DRAFT_2602428 [Pisolithus marmoratus]
MYKNMVPVIHQDDESITMPTFATPTESSMKHVAKHGIEVLKKPLRNMVKMWKSYALSFKKVEIVGDRYLVLLVLDSDFFSELRTQTGMLSKAVYAIYDDTDRAWIQPAQARKLTTLRLQSYISRGEKKKIQSMNRLTYSLLMGCNATTRHLSQIGAMGKLDIPEPGIGIHT